MMRFVLLVAALVPLAGFSSGCSSLSAGIGMAGTPKIAIEGLKRNEYQILGEVEGNATARSAFFGIVKWGPNEGVGNDLPGAFATVKERAYAAAAYDAISKVPDADSLLEPRWNAKTWSVPGLYAGATVTVKAKAIRVKPDTAQK
jgi:hypothetical protein